MGNKQSKNIDVTDYNPSQWKVIGNHKEIAEIVENTTDKQQGQLRILIHDPKLFIQKEVEIYQYRKNTTNPLVKCLTISIQDGKNKTLCGTGTIINVVSQRIPFRFHQLSFVTFQEALYALSEALRGFQECFMRLGPFQITDDMIGVNTQGLIKVWVNSDFSNNHPLVQKPFLYTSGTGKQKQVVIQDFIIGKDEADMVSIVTKIIEKKSQSGKFPSNFSNKLSNNLSFNQAFIIIENYAKKNKIFIPDRIINLEQNDSKSAIHFTPGEQFKRDQNDPMHRRKVQFPPQFPQFKSQNPMFNQNSQNSLQFQQIASPKQKTAKRIQSPIIQLYQSQNPILYEQGTYCYPSDLPIGKPSSSSKTNQRGISQITPEVSTLVFNNQSCVRPHQLGKYKI